MILHVFFVYTNISVTCHIRPNLYSSHDYFNLKKVKYLLKTGNISYHGY